jgi:hypothetical protein
MGKKTVHNGDRYQFFLILAEIWYLSPFTHLTGIFIRGCDPLLTHVYYIYINKLTIYEKDPQY